MSDDASKNPSAPGTGPFLSPIRLPSSQIGAPAAMTDSAAKAWAGEAPTRTLGVTSGNGVPVAPAQSVDAPIAPPAAPAPQAQPTAPAPEPAPESAQPAAPAQPIGAPTTPPAAETGPAAAREPGGRYGVRRKLHYGAIPWPCAEAVQALEKHGAWRCGASTPYPAPVPAFGDAARDASLVSDKVVVRSDFQMLMRGFSKLFGLYALGAGALLGVSPWQAEVIIDGVSEAYSRARRKATPRLAAAREADGEVIHVDKQALIKNAGTLFEVPAYLMADIVSGEPRQHWTRANRLVHACVARFVLEYGYGPADYIAGAESSGDTPIGYLAEQPEGYAKLPVVATLRAAMKAPVGWGHQPRAVEQVVDEPSARAPAIPGDAATQSEAGRVVADMLIARLLKAPQVVRSAALVTLERECAAMFGARPDAIGFLEPVAAVYPPLHVLLNALLKDVSSFPVTSNEFSEAARKGAGVFYSAYTALVGPP